MSPFNQPIVLLSPGLLALGNFPPASRTLRHAAVRSVAPATPYLHNASSCVNSGIHFGSNLGLHCMVSFFRIEFSKESMSSAFAIPLFCGDDGSTTNPDTAAPTVAFVKILMMSRREDVNCGENAQPFSGHVAVNRAIKSTLLFIIMVVLDDYAMMICLVWR